MNTVAAETPTPVHNHDGADYAGFLDRITARLASNLSSDGARLFQTDAPELWSLYLDAFPNRKARQYHRCSACKAFVERFGRLAVIQPDGSLVPALWHTDDAPLEYREAVRRMARAVFRSRVTGAFFSASPTLGRRCTGAWLHLSATLPQAHVHTSRTLKPHEAAAAKKQGFGNVSRILSETPLHVIDKAVALLRAGTVSGSHLVIGPAEWLHTLAHTLESTQPQNRSHVVWRAVATAPEGFLHPRGSMLGTLLDDIKAGKVYTAASRLAAKTRPEVYQRPQTPPAEATIEQAERLIETLGAASALRRRFAQLSEISTLWRAQASTQPAASGVFAHLRNTQQPRSMVVNATPKLMTWEKFSERVLHTADRIEIIAPPVGAYTSLTTAVDLQSTPILQWDHPQNRNPFGYYFWNKPSATAQQFGLRSGQWHDVTAVTLKPDLWHGAASHHGLGVLFIIGGAAESKNPGLCLFPQFLRPEFHPVRSVIEAHSNAGTLEGKDEQSAAGLMLLEGSPWNCRLRVTQGNLQTDYTLDRWE